MLIVSPLFLNTSLLFSFLLLNDLSSLEFLLPTSCNDASSELFPSMLRHDVMCHYKMMIVFSVKHTSLMVHVATFSYFDVEYDLPATVTARKTK